MPFILQDGRLVQVTDSQFAEFGGGEAQLRRTTAAERRARREAETAAAGGQNIQVSDPAAPSNNQEIINPNTTNNTPGQTLTPVAAPLREEDIYQLVAKLCLNTTCKEIWLRHLHCEILVRRAKVCHHPKHRPYLVWIVRADSRPIR